MSSHNVSATYELTTRRRYTPEEKEAMVAECLREGSVSATARRHRIAPAQLFRWKKALAPKLEEAADDAPPSTKESEARPAPAFAPVALIAPPKAGKSKCAPAAKRTREPCEARAVEIAFANGCVLRAPADLDEAALARLIRALKA